MNTTRIASLRFPDGLEARFDQRRPFGRLFLLGTLMLLAFCGCVTGSTEKAYAQMKPEEREMADKLVQIKKGMTTAEVHAIMGPGAGGLSNAWRYWVNPKTVNTTMNFVSQGAAMPEVRNGQFTGGTVRLPTISIQTPYVGTTGIAVGDVFFKNGRVTRVRFVHPALGDSMHGFCIYFVK
jgi:hypothetical protein